MKKTDKRQILLVTWSSCVILILIMYVNTIDPSFKFEKVRELLLSKTVVLLMAQTGAIFGVFLKSPADITVLYRRSRFSKIAFWFILAYILIFTLLVFAGIGFPLTARFKYLEANNMIFYIMTILAVIIDPMLFYWFGSKVKIQSGTGTIN